MVGSATIVVGLPESTRERGRAAGQQFLFDPAKLDDLPGLNGRAGQKTSYSRLACFERDMGAGAPSANENNSSALVSRALAGRSATAAFGTKVPASMA